MKRHLLSAADLTRDDALLVLDTAEELRSAGRPADQEAADPARPHRGQPLLRGLHPHPDLVRGGGQAAVRRRHQLLRQGVERLQGREPQGHRADPAGDGRRRGRHPAPRLRRAAPAGQHAAGSAARWSTPATAPTSTRRRRCSTRSRCAATSASSTAARSRSSATSCTAGWPAPTCCCCTPSAPRSPWSRRRRCCRSASTPGRARRRTTSTRALAKSDVVMMLRVQRERMNAAFFPSAREYSRRYGLDAARMARLPDARDRHAPRPDEPRHGDRRRGRRLAPAR